MINTVEKELDNDEITKESLISQLPAEIKENQEKKLKIISDKVDKIKEFDRNYNSVNDADLLYSRFKSRYNDILDLFNLPDMSLPTKTNKLNEKKESKVENLKKDLNNLIGTYNEIFDDRLKKIEDEKKEDDDLLRGGKTN